MKSFIQRMTTLAIATSAAIAGNIALTPTAMATQFGQQSLNQSRVVAVASPVNGGQSHQLLIIEQQSTQRQCWSEQGNSPTIINPLLLNFNFTGICGRSTDSNGYSVRLANQDMNWQYSLRVVHENNDMVLYAVPAAANLPTLEVGRTRGRTTDFAKINLNPGWSLSKRTYNGSTLGHIYLANTQSASALIAANPPTAPVTPPAATPPANNPPANNPPPQLPNPPTPPVVVPTSPTPGSANGTTYRVTVAARTAAEEARVRQLAPDAFRVTENGQSFMQVGLYTDINAASALVRQFADANLAAVVAPYQRPATGSGVIAGTPGAGTPGSSNTDVYYRVSVPASNAAEEARVRAIVPDAFRVTVNGQAVMQAGIFRDRAVATDRVRQLTNANLRASISTHSGPIATNPTPTTPTSPSSPPTTRPVPQTGIVVMIDPGHGGRDPGAVGINGIKEKDINFAISERVVQQLERQGIRAIMTRSTDREIDLQPRVDIAERADADLFVSIHANSISLSRPDVNGLETYYHQSGRGLAQAIHSSVLQGTNIRDRGVRQANFYVIRNTTMPAVLVETGFVTGREDAARFRDVNARNQIADAIAAGIVRYANQTALR